MNLKKTLLIASLGGAVVSSALAQAPETYFFRWSTSSADSSFTTGVPGFNTAPTAAYPDGRTLTGVEFSIVQPGVVSRFSGGVTYTLPAGAGGTSEVTLTGSPGLSIRFGFLPSFTFSQNISASSGLVNLAGGSSTTVNVGGPLSQGLTPLPINLFSGVSSVPISVRLTGNYLDDTRTPQNTTSMNLPITSRGVGFVRYTYTGTLIPESETYVAGIVLAGLVGWTAHRRLRR